MSLIRCCHTKYPDISLFDSLPTLSRLTGRVLWQLNKLYSSSLGEDIILSHYKLVYIAGKQCVAESAGDGAPQFKMQGLVFGCQVRTEQRFSGEPRGSNVGRAAGGTTDKRWL